MAVVVTVDEAKTQLSELMTKAERGEEVIIARGDQPSVRLVPIMSTKPKREPGWLKGKLMVPDSFFEPLSDEELGLWEADDN